MLPDEIVSEILSPALKVPDKLFADTSSVSPFATYDPSTSAYLLVCKDWLRVATPLLYHVVILRSKAQANALEKVLVRNPEFGRYIKKLRVEGGYGMAMHTILKFAPSVTDLFLSLSIYSSDGTAGLCKGLPLINPDRVIVLDPWIYKPIKNKNLADLTQTLLSCIQTWTNLKIFGFPYGSNADVGAVWPERARNLVRGLAKAHSVHTILLSSTFRSIPQFIKQLCDIPSLHLIQFEQPLGEEYYYYDDDDDDVISQITSDPRLKALACYNTFQPPKKPDVSSGFMPDIAPSLNPSFVPMESASEETREIVWKRVLFFAMYVEEFRDPAFPHWPTSSYQSRLPILCVSRYFNRLALPYIYDAPYLSIRTMPKFAKQLQQRPHLGSFIRFLFAPIGAAVTAENMLQILSHATNVESFLPRSSTGPYAARVSAEPLDMLARTTGPSLREICITLEMSTISTSLLAHFTHVRILELRGWNTISVIPDEALYALPSLHTLRIGNPSFLDVFTIMRLESLHTVVLPYVVDAPDLIKFLKAHGHRLLHFTVGTIHGDDKFKFLDLCSSLEDVQFLGECDVFQLTRETPCRSLTKIIAERLPDDFEKLSLAFFLALREIHLTQLEWPTTERDINKSKCVPIAESLLEKSIKLIDSTGKQWIPRVKSTRTRKR
ncbi:F-box domain-containing protein [Mycena venus]|uniref:F-box domain-containing protein n=1 Tax=Mycena venus TaxID=2733690 RepID=A0A8H7DE13_9AGAR|nr:F-box domain-containing protein [Mycena venus]